MNIYMPHNFLHVMILMIFIVACSVPAASSPAAQTIIASENIAGVIAKYRREIPQLMHQQNIPGLAISVVDDQNILWVEGFGFTDTDRRVLIMPDPIFSIESMSKIFTATGVLMAVQEGLLDLDTPITTYLHCFTVHSIFEVHPQRKITIRHLLSHMPRFTHEAPRGNNFDGDVTSFEAHIRSISDTWLRFPVGTGFADPNLGIDLAGYILQQVSGESFANYERDHIFQPLGMANSLFDMTVIQANPNRAIGHSSPSPSVPLRIKEKVDMIIKSIILFVILAAVLASAYIISRQRLQARLASQSQIAQTAVGPVEYIDIGQGPVVVHMHGMLGGYDHWKWCRYLVKAGFRVIVPSRPGYLRTPLSSGTTPAKQAALIASLLDALGIDGAAFYAYSQGGAASLQFAWTYPERCWGLILFSSLTRSQPDFAKFLPTVRIIMSLDFLLWLLQPVCLPWIMAQAKKALPTEIQQDGEKIAGIREILGASFQASLRGRGLVNDFNNTISWPGLPLERLAIPTLILHGRKDSIIKIEDSKAAAQVIPGAKFQCLEDSGHEALVTCVDQIRPMILDFLNSHIPILQVS